MKYSIDSSSLITAWNIYYPVEVFPSLWDNISDLIENDILKASVHVYDELDRQDDELFEWVKARKDKLIVYDTIEVQREYRTLVNTYKAIEPNAVTTNADPYIISLAKINNAFVVSEEVYKPSPKKRKRLGQTIVEISIVNICREVEVSCIKFVELFKQEQWSF